MAHSDKINRILLVPYYNSNVIWSCSDDGQIRVWYLLVCFSLFFSLLFHTLLQLFHECIPSLLLRPFPSFCISGFYKCILLPLQFVVSSFIFFIFYSLQVYFPFFTFSSHPLPPLYLLLFPFPLCPPN